MCIHMSVHMHICVPVHMPVQHALWCSVDPHCVLGASNGAWAHGGVTEDKTAAATATASILQPITTQPSASPILQPLTAQPLASPPSVVDLGNLPASSASRCVDMCMDVCIDMHMGMHIRHVQGWAYNHVYRDIQRDMRCMSLPSSTITNMP